MRSKNEKSSTRRYWISRFWRSGWDSNPRAREGKCISSAPRYDRFDTAPRILSPKFLFQLKTDLERTGGENYKKYSIRVPKKLRKNKENADTNCTQWMRISSQPRYDHFDTAPCIFFAKILLSNQNCFGKNWRKELQKIFNSSPQKTEEKQGKR